MGGKIMNYDQLYAFYYVSKVMNFTKASEILNLTQPAITTRIRNLEDELSCQLFDKQGKRLNLTKEGKILLEYAKKIIFYAGEAKEALSIANQPQLTIGFSPAFSNKVITKAVKEFVPNHEYIYLKIIEQHDSLDLLEQVKNQTLDLAFVRTPTFDPNLTVDNVFKDKIYIFVSPDHPLSTKKIVTKEDLEGQTMVHYSRSMGYWKRVEETVVGVKDLKKFEVRNMELMKKFVKEGLGFSILPYFTLHEEEQKGEIVVIEYEPLNEIPRDIVSVYYTGSARTDLIKTFISCCMKHIESDPIYSF
ncbi:MAG TPA: hypothetical protein DDY49_08975 [Paenibacillaceae bacterium]|nr:hypothetical protein [Paenibacillaceae bacterium]